MNFFFLKTCNSRHCFIKSYLEKPETFSYSFDESRYEFTQTYEMDLFVPFWAGSGNCVKVRYYGSTLLGHDRHTDKLNHLVGMAKDVKSA